MITTSTLDSLAEVLDQLMEAEEKGPAATELANLYHATKNWAEKNDLVCPTLEQITKERLALEAEFGTGITSLALMLHLEVMYRVAVREDSAVPVSMWMGLLSGFLARIAAYAFHIQGLTLQDLEAMAQITQV